MPQIKVKDNEPFDIAIRRFKRSCEKAGVIAEVRRREFYEKPTSVRKRKAAAAVKRHQKKSGRDSRYLLSRTIPFFPNLFVFFFEFLGDFRFIFSLAFYNIFVFFCK